MRIIRWILPSGTSNWFKNNLKEHWARIRCKTAAATRRPFFAFPFSSWIVRRRVSRRNEGVARKSFKRRVKQTDQLLAWVMERRDCFPFGRTLPFLEDLSWSALFLTCSLIHCQTQHATFPMPRCTSERLLRYVNLSGNFLAVRGDVLSWEHLRTFTYVLMREIIKLYNVSRYNWENLIIRCSLQDVRVWKDEKSLNEGYNNNFND